MKKLGKEVLLLKTSDTNPRNGEGSFIKLSNGSILFGFTEFIGSTREDEENARISAVVSENNGETWSERFILFEKPAGSVNIMSLSFLRMKNGDIGAFYIIKNQDGTDRIVFRRSSDDCKTWTEPVNCTDCLEIQDYYVINNDRVIMLENGRIILPLARHTIHGGYEDFAPGLICFIISDDDGKTWYKTEAELPCPFANNIDGYEEPGLYVLPDGKIWCYIRTDIGFQFESFSADNGLTWSFPEPNMFFSSACSPMLVKDCEKYTVAVFNPIPEHSLRKESEPWGRTPYVIAVSEDRGLTFKKEKMFYLEDDLNNGYCYPAIYEGDDYFLVAYYHSYGTDNCLNYCKLKKIYYKEIFS